MPQTARWNQGVNSLVEPLGSRIVRLLPHAPTKRTLVEDFEDSYDPLQTRRIQNSVATQSDPIFLDHQLPAGELSGIIGGFGVGQGTSVSATLDTWARGSGSFCQRAL
jgi:hypothetical protein